MAIASLLPSSDTMLDVGAWCGGALALAALLKLLVNTRPVRWTIKQVDKFFALIGRKILAGVRDAILEPISPVLEDLKVRAESNAVAARLANDAAIKATEVAVAGVEATAKAHTSVLEILGELRPNHGTSFADRVEAVASRVETVSEKQDEITESLSNVCSSQGTIVGRIEEFQAQCDRRARALYPPELQDADGAPGGG